MGLFLEKWFILGSQIKTPWELRGNFVGSRTILPGQFIPGQLPPLHPGELPPRTIALWTNPPDNSTYDYCIAPGQVHPDNCWLERWQLQITIFSWLFSVSFPQPNYNFCYDNKNNNDNSNKTWSLKLMSVIKL